MSGKGPDNSAPFEFIVLIVLIQLSMASATGAIWLLISEPRTQKFKGVSSCARKNYLLLNLYPFIREIFQK